MKYLKPRGIEPDPVAVERIRFGVPVDAGPDDRLAAFLELNRRGAPASAISQRLRVSARTVERWRFRYATRPGCTRADILSRWTRCGCARCRRTTLAAQRRAYRARGGRVAPKDWAAIRDVVSGVPSELTRPERAEAIRRMIRAGMDRREIARRAGVTVRAVEWHITQMRRGSK